MPAKARPLLKLRRPLAAPPAAPPVAAKPAPTKAAEEPAPPTPAKPKVERPVPGADTRWDVYYYNWSPTEFRPHRRYACEEDARTEASRLRGLIPEKRFKVYRAVCIDADERPEGQAPSVAAEAAVVPAPAPERREGAAR